MALSASGIFNCQQNATAGNVNAGYFNPTNANFPTDATATSATGNAPVISSASYNFVAGDVGAWVYVKSGTNWTAGWYVISSVAANAATVNATIGAAVTLTNGIYATNTVAGVATVASPTGGTFGVDYSQGTAAILAITDAVSTASTTVTSVGAGMRRSFIGNGFHLASGTGTPTAGWYEVVNYTNTTTIVLDAVSGTYTAGVAKIGGALSLASSDDAVFELAVSSATAATIFNVKGSATAYTLGGTVSITAAGNAAWPIRIIGYTTKPGDACTGTSRPTFDCGAASFTLGSTWWAVNMIFTGTADGVLIGATSTVFSNIKLTNTSPTADRAGITIGAVNYLFNSEIICFRGVGVSCGSGSGAAVVSCWVHDSKIGIQYTSSSNFQIIGCIVSSCTTNAIKFTGALTGPVIIANNTLYGGVNKTGLGLQFATGTTAIRVTNNIFYGFTTAITHADTNLVGLDDWNDFQNNTNDVSGGTNPSAQWQKGSHDTAVAPSFTSATQVTGATATTTATNHLVQSGATFVTSGVTAGRDFVYIVSGTGVTAGIYSILTVDSETQLTTGEALTANATADKVFQITVGQNFGVGTAMKALGIPGVFQGGLTTSYGEQGAVQRQESGGATSYSFAG